jgi:hypothetical protein
MPRNKGLDQFMLLFVGVAMTVGVVWLWSFLEHHGIPDRMGFFIVFNIGEFFILTWQAVPSFRHIPRFWLSYGCWAVAHTIAYVVWGYSGYRIELCVVALPLEHYVCYRIARSRLRVNLEADSQLNT